MHGFEVERHHFERLDLLHDFTHFEDEQENCSKTSCCIMFSIVDFSTTRPLYTRKFGMSIKSAQKKPRLRGKIRQSGAEAEPWAASSSAADAERSFAIPVHSMIVIPIFARNDLLPPGLVVQIPLNGLLDAVFELRFGQPAELGVDLGRVDGIAQIVALAVCDIGDEARSSQAPYR